MEGHTLGEMEVIDIIMYVYGDKPGQVEEYCRVEELPLWWILYGHGEDSLKTK